MNIQSYNCEYSNILKNIKILMKNTKSLFVFILLMVLVSCQIKTGISFPGQDEPTLQLSIDLPRTATPIPTETKKPEPTLTPAATSIVILDPGPSLVEFQTEDGVMLSGNFIQLKLIQPR